MTDGFSIPPAMQFLQNLQALSKRSDARPKFNPRCAGEMTSYLPLGN
jgi:hypothetical protein